MLHFNGKKPAARGYGYVGCSRFKSRSGCYLYGKLRRSDFLPVGEEKEDEVLERGYLSLSSDDEDGPGREYIGGQDWNELADASDFDVSERAGNALLAVDFD